MVSISDILFIIKCGRCPVTKTVPLRLWLCCSLLVVSSSSSSSQDPCRGVVTLKSREGVIDYPSGPGDYNSFQDCKWVIMGSANQKVHIKFMMISIEKDSPCDDFVQISQVNRNSITTPTRVYGRLCASTLSELPEKQREFTVESPYVLIHFHSDWIWTAKGFVLRYRLEDENPPTKPTQSPQLPGACKSTGITVKDPSGVIEFNSGYHANAQCRWFIAGGKNTDLVKVTIVSLDIESTPKCKGDKLVIASVDMRKNTFSPVSTLCGSTVPESVVTVPTHSAYIIFTSDAQNNGKGFKLKYESVRSQQVTLPPPTAIAPVTTPGHAGNVTPSYPTDDPCVGHGAVVHGNEGTIDFYNNYRNGAKCSWFLAVDANAYQIWLTITEIDIKGTGKKCEGDRLLIAAVILEQNQVIPVEVLCGTKPPSQPVIVSSIFAYIGFRSDGSDTGRGFRITYTAKLPESPVTTPSPGPTATVEPSPDLQALNCSFETGKTCKWVNSGDGITWMVQVAGKSMWKDYAKVDHTTGSNKGSYIYLYTNEAKPGSKGALKSPLLSATHKDGHCLIFWYNMYDTAGKTKVDIRPQGQTEETLFERDGNQGNLWHEAKVALMSDVPFEIYLIHERGDKISETGLAIDDIHITASPCLATALSCGRNRYDTTKTRDTESLGDDFDHHIRALEGMLEQERDITKRVISGVPSRQGEWPWIVHLRNFRHGLSAGVYGQCGGTLIDRKWVLTAAHCFEDEDVVYKDPNNVLLYFGEHNVAHGNIEDAQFSLKPLQVHLHPNRNKKVKGSSAHRFDLALVQLRAPVTLSEYVNVACLPSGPVKTGTDCVAAGWGTDESGATSVHLLHIAQKILPRKDCIYRTFDDQICSISLQGFGDVCSGDSGGPLVCKNNGKYELVGAVSFGDRCSLRQRTPGVYASIHHAISWIETTMSNN